MNTFTTILATILIFGVIIFIHELGHFLCALAAGVKINEFSLGMGPKVFSKEINSIVYSFRLFPIGGFVAMEGEDEDSNDQNAFCNKKVWKRIVVVCAGAAMNIILGFAIIITVISGSKLISTTIIANFADGATSSETLQVKDEIIRVNGRKVATVNNIGLELMKDQDGLVDMVVKRNGKTTELKNVPFKMSEVDEGIEMIQMDFQVYGKQPTFFGVIKESYHWTLGLMEQTYVSFMDLVTGRYGLKQLSGPVGVAEVIGEATSVGFSSVLMMTALLSINIGIFNLLPLPALDGGRLVFLIIEGIFRKPVPAKYEGVIHSVGFLLLIGLMVVVTFKDIINLF
ncbi:MAG: M50 family metallopeptidase [Oscillospiraceae bacterium]